VIGVQVPFCEASSLWKQQQILLVTMHVRALCWLQCLATMPVLPVRFVISRKALATELNSSQTRGSRDHGLLQGPLVLANNVLRNSALLEI
jgi:hypothetical protein